MLFVEELGQGLGRDPGFLGEHSRRYGGNGQAAYRGATSCPGVPGSAQHPGLARTGRADDTGEAFPAFADPSQGGGLIGAQTMRAHRSFHPWHGGDRDASAATPDRGVEDPTLQSERFPGALSRGAVAFVGSKPVPSTQTVGDLGGERGGQGDDFGVGKHRRAGRLDPPPARLGVAGQVKRQATGRRLGHLPPTPGGASLGQLLDQLGHHRRVGDLLVESHGDGNPLERLRQPAAGFPSADSRFGAPPAADGRLVVVGLSRTGLVGGELVLLRPLVVRQRPAKSGLGHRYALRSPALDVPAGLPRAGDGPRRTAWPADPPPRSRTTRGRPRLSPAHTPGSWPWPRK